MSRRLRVPGDPVRLAYFLLGWDKRFGHLPCGESGCADCTAALKDLEAEFARLPLREDAAPAERLTRATARNFYVDPSGSGFDPRLVP
jgi:hypothetical protein